MRGAFGGLGEGVSAMTWNPTTKQLETIAILGNARAPVGKIAAAVGIGEAEFKAWTARLVATRALDIPEPCQPPPLPIVPTPIRTRSLAERVFERPDAEG
jgi:hypothetical protein